MLTINISELILTVLNFFLLLFLLKRFLYAPLVAFMEARQSRIDAGFEEEQTALAEIRQQELLYASKRRECHEEARHILQDAQMAEDLRRAELEAKAKEQAARDRKAAKCAEIRRNEEESQLLQEQRMQLASLLADSLLERFSQMPFVVFEDGRRIRAQREKNHVTEMDSRPVELQGPAEEHTEGETDQMVDLFAPDVYAAHCDELQKSKEEQQQLDEQWEQLAALLAERLLCPGA